MELPRKHHYNPAFYLDRFVGPDGYVREMRLVRGKVVLKSRHPDATGFQRDLYRIEGAPEEHSQHLEVHFMSPLDNGAARALERIEAGDTMDWSADERSEWVRFVIGFLFRHPASVALIKKHFADMFQGAIEALERHYDEVRGPNDPATFAEAYAQSNPAAAEIHATNMIAELIDNDRLGPTIFDMRWAVLEMKRSKFSVLTSDRPIYLPVPLGRPDAYILLPISPTKYFVAARQHPTIKALNQLDRTTLVREVNTALVQQAREFVWGCDDSQRRFVEKHFAKLPERELLTEAQMQEAINAARGATAKDFEE
ncbi:DUF4238 domain-containing protein [Bradyrhizobium sp. 192]|uniref:DUF4238 domain-containing protein n=1 Tax=Bradyrhizobium sp. 192 TaxID=2782660 RepID=UPI001FFE60E7|nr:DUF4238 domain-containing protein [Bradyrhizobium sp. 192]UPJ55534.1 DUF4238 domain-containing protein [Bradyrhizobium sp. 192]